MCPDLAQSRPSGKVWDVVGQTHSSCLYACFHPPPASPHASSTCSVGPQTLEGIRVPWGTCKNSSNNNIASWVQLWRSRFRGSGLVPGNLNVSCHNRWVPGLDLRNSTLKSWLPALLDGQEPCPGPPQGTHPGPASFMASLHRSLLPTNPNSSSSFRTQPPPPPLGSLH